ncbi:thiamine-phosphate kinase [Georgenia sp. Z1491]|uniref:thiamine-phosphate kinase n=1 Tax=Georgenia sp. Z1491 TaxID=3416707 RepID=UPI003CF3DAA8
MTTDPASPGPHVDTDATSADDPGGHATTVRDVGEDGVLAVLLPELPVGDRTLVGPGDDCAVVASSDPRLVVSADMLLEGHHFRTDWGTGIDVGRRAAAQNLADVAAMGADPLALVVSLGLPGDTPLARVRDLARGLALACGPIGVGVVGGDLTASERLVISVAVHGDLRGGEPVLRSGARPGDVLAHAGVLGRAAAGYALLSAGRTGGDGTDALVAAFLSPDPPIALGPVAREAGATAMIDVSDGLLRDAGRIARASGVVVDVDSRAAGEADLDALGPVAAELGNDPMEWVLRGGEDHGLLATFPAGAPLPEGFRAIGRVRALDDVSGIEAPTPTVDGLGASVLLDSGPVGGIGGWDHFV